MDDVELEFGEGAAEAIAKEAIRRKTGAVPYAALWKS